MSTPNPPSHLKPRVVAGVPTGGQWTVAQHAESAVSLVSDPGAALSAIKARHDDLAAGGFVPAIATAALDDPSRTYGRQGWWDTHFATGEYRAGGGGHAQMPDDYTPSRTRGNAMSGARRTHRMKYSSDTMTLRMPSATSIKRFSQDESQRTFDVPVSSSYVDAEGQQRTVAGWVRVTRGGAGSWSATGMGFAPGADEQVAEAVSAILESRRPSRALREVGDLIARRKEREEAAGVQMTALSSGWISAVGYDEESGIMATRTATGATYGHMVSRARFKAVAQSSSPGATFNSLVKGRDRAQVSHCDNCGRFYSAVKAHACAPVAAPASSEAVAQNVAARSRAAAATGGPQVLSAMSATLSREQSAPARPWGQHVAGEDTKTIDIQAMLDEQLAVRSGKTGFFGAPGFTRGAIGDAVQPFTSSLYHPRAFDRYGYGDQMFDAVNGDNGMFRFSGLGAEQAKSLLGSLSSRQLQDRQNGSPTAGSLLAAAAAHPGSVEVHGYMIGPLRNDERVSVEGAYVYDPSITSPAQAWEVLQAKYGVDDAMAAPDEVDECENPWRPGEKGWRIWWD